MNTSPYVFSHGADFEVTLIGSSVKRGADIQKYAVIGGGFKVFFEMMKLIPKMSYHNSKPRKWGFGHITDVMTGSVLWEFRSFIRSDFAKSVGLSGFEGDLITECGEDNRTYVVCRRRRDDVVVARFLMAELLPQWRLVAFMEVPALSPPVQLVADYVPEAFVPRVVVDRPVTVVPLPLLRRTIPVLTLVKPVTLPAAIPPGIPATRPLAVVAVDAEHNWFFTEVLSKM